MSPTSRDRKLLLLLIPLVAILGYWFLLLAPQRQEASKLAEELTQQEEKADAANANADRLKAAAKDFRGEYTSLVRLGKAVPSSVDMPSLLVQLNRAAAGTGIRFGSITVGDRASAAAAASGGSAQPPAGGGSGGGQAPPAAAGGQPAQSTPGKAAEKGNDAAAGANQSNQARSQDPTNPQTSTSAKQGAVPVGGAAPAQTAQQGAAAGAGGAATSGVPGLDSVPLEMSFRGNYFDLARFFHRLKRFVRVANEKIKVQGRLLTIDGLSFTGGARLVAVVKATVYLVPKDQGVGAGATPAGPQATPTSAAGAQSTPPSSTTAPTATATPR